MDYQDELVFLTINRKLDLAGVEIKEGQDLPLIKSSMVQNLKDKNWQESIPFIDFLLGMVLCQTVDPALAQSQGYDKILQKSSYQGQVISRIMTGDFDRQAKMDFFYNVAFFNHFTNGHIEANGALLDRAYKSFRDTLDFKEGSVGAVGGEEEFTLLLSEEAKSLAVPILLCHEDLVQANHAASNGKLDEDILFYLMSRGFPRSEAEGLIVESRMRPSLDRIPDEDLRESLKKVIHERIVNRHGK